MIKSMTGFGRSELKTSLGYIRVEIKTVNHKFFELSSRLPGQLNEFEDMFRRLIQQEIKRGKIHLFVLSPDPTSVSSGLILNEALAKEVHRKLKKLSSAIGVQPKDESFFLREVMRYPDVLTRDHSFQERQKFSKDLSRAVSLAVESLSKSRAEEGKALEKDLKKRVDEIRKSMKLIEKRVPELRGVYQKTLENRMKTFMSGGQVDPDRMTQEVAAYLKNSDISEEISRLKSHVDAMTKTLTEKIEIGRKIDFIAQEMSREANTMGAKSSDSLLSSQVIAIKSAIDKIREQAQNVE